MYESESSRVYTTLFPRDIIREYFTIRREVYTYIFRAILKGWEEKTPLDTFVACIFPAKQGENSLSTSQPGPVFADNRKFPCSRIRYTRTTKKSRRSARAPMRKWAATLSTFYFYISRGDARSAATGEIKLLRVKQRRSFQYISK